MKTIIGLIIFFIGLVGTAASLFLISYKTVQKRKAPRAKKAVLICIGLMLVSFALIREGAEEELAKTQQLSESRDSVCFRDDQGAVYCQLPDEIRNNTGEIIRLSDSRLTIIDLWEPWAEPCREELINMQALYEQYGNQGLNVIGLFISEEGAGRMIEECGVRFPVLFYRDDFAFLKLGQFPAAAIADSSGRLLTICSPGEEEIKEIFNGETGEEEAAIAAVVSLGPKSRDFWEEIIVRELNGSVK